MDTLRQSLYCIAVDLPGHGGSVRSDPPYTMPKTLDGLRRVLNEVGASSSAIVGYSMGGRIALHFAVRHPDACSRLVIESASPGLADAAERLERRGADEALAIRLETDDLRAFLEDWYGRPLFHTLRARADLVRAMVESRAANDARELARSLRSLGTGVQQPLWESLPELRMPALAIVGALDGKYVEIAQRMALLMPKLRTAIIPNAGHNVHAERPGEFVEVLREFL
jgi:2-succinyl-6-hydroxy-2,4-cyclohexadiene-1-carboxylate synthase